MSDAFGQVLLMN